MLSYGLERKEGFYDDKNVNFVKKKWVFFKGITQGFGQKIENFFSLFLTKKGLEIMVLVQKWPFFQLFF